MPHSSPRLEIQCAGHMARVTRVAGAACLLLVSAVSSAGAQARGANWTDFKVGDRAELDVACSGHWEPVSITKIEAVEGRTEKDYHVRRGDGSDWSFRAPGIVAPCGRAIGGLAKDRLALPALPTGFYGCTYRGQPVPAMEFALLSRSTYKDRDGADGIYRVDEEARILTFVTGPMRGMRAQQTMPASVQMLRPDGMGSGNVCAHNPKRTRL